MSSGAAAPNNEEDKKPEAGGAHINLKVKGQVRFFFLRFLGFRFWNFQFLGFPFDLNFVDRWFFNFGYLVYDIWNSFVLLWLIVEAFGFSLFWFDHLIGLIKVIFFLDLWIDFYFNFVIIFNYALWFGI